jgi:hypothetical protein
MPGFSHCRTVDGNQRSFSPIDYYKFCSELLQILPYIAQTHPRSIFFVARQKGRAT